MFIYILISGTVASGAKTSTLNGCDRCLHYGWSSIANQQTCNPATRCSGNYAGIAININTGGINTGCVCAAGYEGTANQDISSGVLYGCFACNTTKGYWSQAGNGNKCFYSPASIIQSNNNQSKNDMKAAIDDQLSNISISITSGVVVFALVWFIVCKLKLNKQYPEARNYAILTFLKGALDFFTDILFIYSLMYGAVQEENVNYYIWFSLAFLIIPWILNLSYIIYTLNKEINSNPDFSAYFQKYASFFTLLAVFNATMAGIRLYFKCIYDVNNY